MIRPTFFLAFVVVCLSAAHGDDIQISDFESVALSNQWTARGEVSADRGDAPEPQEAGPRGKALHLSTRGRGALMTKPDAIRIAGAEACEELVFWARTDRAGAIDVLFIEADNQALFWRRVDLEAGGWKQVRVPLAWFRWETGRVPRWSAVRSFAFRLRAGADVWVDDIRLLDRRKEAGAHYSIDELTRLGFDGLAGTVRQKDGGDFWILTNADGLDLDLLGGHLAKVFDRVKKDFGLAGPPRQPCQLLIFADREQYTDFVPRLAKALNARADQPTSDGYHLQGIALSSWNAQRGTLRPVYTHEFVHSILSHCALVDSAQSDWFQEGVASRYQLIFHPQEDFAAIVRKGLADPQLRMELEKLCTGGDIPLTRYWQALTLVEMLMESPKYRETFPKLLEAIRAKGSTDLRPHIEAVLETTWEKLDADWREFAGTKYAPVK